MTKAVVWAATLLAASLGATAQETAVPAQPESAAQPHRIVTIAGCLAVPQPGGSYILTDATGIAYKLEGDTSSLQAHMQQEIQVTGQLSSSAINSSNTLVQSPASSARSSVRGTSANGGRIELANVKVLASQCREPIHNTDPQDQSTHSISGHLRNVSASAAQDRAANPSPDAKATGQLPQTSTILPLLGLIGLGSLVAGLFARK